MQAAFSIMCKTTERVLRGFSGIMLVTSVCSKKLLFCIFQPQFHACQGILNRAVQETPVLANNLALATRKLAGERLQLVVPPPKHKCTSMSWAIRSKSNTIKSQEQEH